MSTQKKVVSVSKGAVIVFVATCILFVAACTIGARPVATVEIQFRSFSGAGAIGPPADAYAATLAALTETALGKGGTVNFIKLSPRPAIPKKFGGSVVAAVGAGGPLAKGDGFDAAYVSGSSLNAAWGFIYNSGVPFGPSFDEFLGFLYGSSVDDGRKSGLTLLQETLDRRNQNVVVIPIVGSSHQGSGYFMKPVGDTASTTGIGLKGLCQEPWTFRYLPPAQYVLDVACDNLVAAGTIPEKKISFVKAVAGGKIVRNVIDGKVQAFEFATPLDDVSVLFSRPEGNPGTAGARFLHYPGWHQPFLVTYLVVNKQVWNMLTDAQKALVFTVARGHVATSYGENLRQQGGKLQEILAANKDDADQTNDIVLVRWPDNDLELLKKAAIQFLNARSEASSLKVQDREDYSRILNAFRGYVSSNNGYWKRRAVPSAFRFTGWVDPHKEEWDQRF